MGLRSAGLLKPSAPSLSIPKLSSFTSLAQIQPAPTTPGLPRAFPVSPKVEPDSSSKRRENTSSSKSQTSSFCSCREQCVWRGPLSVTVMRITNGVTRTKVTINIMKEVENVNKNMAIKRARACTVSMPQGMTMPGQRSLADLLNPVIPLSIPIQREEDFAVKADYAVMSTGAPAHQNAYAFHHQHFILLLSFHIICLPI